MIIFNYYLKFEKYNKYLSDVRSLHENKNFIYGRYVFRIFNHSLHCAPMIVNYNLCDSLKSLSDKEKYFIYRSFYLSLVKLRRDGYMHRDINIGNIIFNNGSLKLIDWEHVHLIGKDIDYDNSKKGLGHPLYLSPYLWDDRYSLTNLFRDFIYDTKILNRLNIISKSISNKYLYTLTKIEIYRKEIRCLSNMSLSKIEFCGNISCLNKYIINNKSMHFEIIINGRTYNDKNEYSRCQSSTIKLINIMTMILNYNKLFFRIKFDRRDLEAILPLGGGLGFIMVKLYLLSKEDNSIEFYFTKNGYCEPCKQEKNILLFCEMLVGGFVGFLWAISRKIKKQLLSR